MTLARHIASQEQFDAWLERLADGEDPYPAAHELGTTLSALKRGDLETYEDAIEASKEIREGIANTLLEKRAHEPDSDPRVLLAYARAESSRYRQAERVELTGEGGGPVQTEQRGVSFGGVIALAEELGILDQIGRQAGSDEALPAAREVLPARPNLETA